MQPSDGLFPDSERVLCRCSPRDRYAILMGVRARQHGAHPGRAGRAGRVRPASAIDGKHIAVTKRERVYASIQRQSLDAIPWQFDLSGALADRLKVYLKTDNVAAALDDHFACADMPDAESAIGEPVPKGCRRDAFGGLWRHAAADRQVGDWGGHVGYPLHEPSLKGFRFPDPPADPSRNRSVARARREHPDDFLWAPAGSVFERGWALCGFENFLGYVAGEAAFVEEITERLADYCCGQLSLLKGLDLDAACFGDDWGFQRQPTRRSRTSSRLPTRRGPSLRDSGES